MPSTPEARWEQGHRASRLRAGLTFLDYNSEQFGAKKDTSFDC